jgi:hypothetical protein
MSLSSQNFLPLTLQEKMLKESSIEIGNNSNCLADQNIPLGEDFDSALSDTSSTLSVTDFGDTCHLSDAEWDDLSDFDPVHDEESMSDENAVFSCSSIDESMKMEIPASEVDTVQPTESVKDVSVPTTLFQIPIENRLPLVPLTTNINFLRNVIMNNRRPMINIHPNKIGHANNTIKIDSISLQIYGFFTNQLESYGILDDNNTCSIVMCNSDEYKKFIYGLCIKIREYVHKHQIKTGSVDLLYQKEIARTSYGISKSGVVFYDHRPISYPQFQYMFPTLHSSRKNTFQVPEIVKSSYTPERKVKVFIKPKTITFKADEIVLNDMISSVCIDCL